MNYNDLATYFVNACVRFKQIFVYQPLLTKQQADIAYVMEETGFIIPIEGKLAFTIENTAYCVEPGTVIHAAKGTIMNQKRLTKESVQFAVVYFEQGKEQCISKTHFKMDVAQVEELLQTVAQLKHYDEQPAAVASLKCQAIFYDLLEQMIEGMQKSQETEYGIQEILAYMHAHYQQPISVTEIANHFNIERRHLAYIFKRHTGMSPLNYLTEYRIRLAKELLRQQQYQIMKVAELVGFEDNLYFSRIFKKRTGHSPSAYRDHFNTVHN